MNNIPVVNTSEQLANAPKKSIFRVLLNLVRPSQPNDGQPALSQGTPIEIASNGIIMHGNHRYYDAQAQGQTHISATLFNPASDENPQP